MLPWLIWVFIGFVGWIFVLIALGISIIVDGSLLLRPVIVIAGLIKFGEVITYYPFKFNILIFVFCSDLRLHGDGRVQSI